MTSNIPTPNAQFTPASNVIVAISNEFQAIITTQSPHGYFVGAFVRLYIPKGFGPENFLNYAKAFIVSIPSPTTFQSDLNTTSLPPFVIPTNSTQFAQVVPIGEAALSLLSSKRNTLGNPPDINF